jgi:hypothetical protein
MRCAAPPGQACWCTQTSLQFCCPVSALPDRASPTFPPSACNASCACRWHGPPRTQVQYRMHPCLSEFPSNTFYEGTLQNGTGMGDRRLAGMDFPWPNPNKPMMFWVQLGAEEISASGEHACRRRTAARTGPGPGRSRFTALALNTGRRAGGRGRGGQEPRLRGLCMHVHASQLGKGRGRHLLIARTNSMRGAPVHGPQAHRTSTEQRLLQWRRW